MPFSFQLKAYAFHFIKDGRRLQKRTEANYSDKRYFKLWFLQSFTVFISVIAIFVLWSRVWRSFPETVSSLMFSCNYNAVCVPWNKVQIWPAVVDDVLKEPEHYFVTFSPCTRAVLKKLCREHAIWAFPSRPYSRTFFGENADFLPKGIWGASWSSFPYITDFAPTLWLCTRTIGRLAKR